MCTTGPAADPSSQIKELIPALEARAADLPKTALGQELVEIRGLIDRLECTFAHTLRRFHDAQAFHADGAVSTVSWLRWRCRLSGSAAGDRVGVAHWLDQLPVIDQAFADGTLGYQHVAVVARTADRVGAAEMQKAQPDFVASAKELDPGRYSAGAREFWYLKDPNGVQAEANRTFARRYLDVQQYWDGYVRLEGLLDAEGGATLQTALNALSPPSAGEPRSPWQRRADALVELCRRQLDAGALPAGGGQRPHLTVTVPAATLAATPGHPPADLNGRCSVPAETARRLACDAALTVVTLDGEGRPLGAGRTTRTVPPALRRALAARDRGCRFPSCDRPAEWTDGHHLRHWADGGETRLPNLVLLCRRHHRKAHEEGWRLLWGDDGALLAIPPASLRARPPAPAGGAPSAALARASPDG